MVQSNPPAIRNKMNLVSSSDTFSASNLSASAPLRLRYRHRSCDWPSPFADVDQCQHGIGAVSVLCQAAVAHLHEAPNALEGQERVFDLRSYGRFSAIGLSIALAERAVAVPGLVGEVASTRGDSLQLLPLLLSPISAVA